MKQPKNNNYCATLVEIKQLIPLDNCDNVCHTLIMGNKVIVGKDTQIGDIGLFFPVETQLSAEYISANNLFIKKELNANPEKGGYFEENRRIRCIKFRGNSSEGLFMPFESIDFIFGEDDVEGYKIGDEFDELKGIPICNKYISKYSKTPGEPGSKNSKQPKESKIIENQFRFHQDTSQLYKNLHEIKPESLISISYKEHGTSCISSKILCKRKLNWIEKVLKKLGVNINDKKYDYIYSSRKVIKNEDLNPNANHFYKEAIWGMAHNKLKEFLQDGMSIYFEIVGYLPSGAEIQKDFDYGCKPNEFAIKIYRITLTNYSGKVFEFSAKQVQDWCKENGLNAVEELFYGYAKDLSDERMTEENWRNKFLETVKSKYNEKNCHLCSKPVPEEGCVVRVEGNKFKAFKCKSIRFYEFETKMLDKNIVDIELNDE